jgi:hypothetical protein
MLYKDLRYVLEKTYRIRVEHKYRGEICNGKQLKRSSSQIDEGFARPDSATIPKHTAHAWLPDNHKNPQNFRSLLWTKHNLSSLGHTREERVREKRMEHEQ